jgi:hypothetical protein
MTARKADPKPKVGITINRAKASQTAAAARQPSQASTPAQGSLIINSMQADILDALVAAGGQALTVVQLQEACGVGKTVMYRSFTDCKERELVDVDINGAHLRQLVTVTAKGRRALHTYRSKQAHKDAHGLAAPRTHICTEPYTPPAGTYQRNSGHAHIASHGFRC